LDEFDRLGFRLTHPIDREKFNAVVAAAGLFLPPDYLQFVGYSLTGADTFVYRFISAKSNAEWEGQVAEFADYSAGPCELVAAVVRSMEKVMLPIAADAGGNWLLLHLDQDDPAVYDLDYSSGDLSAVAPTFQSFLHLLHREE
jgi:hypothetical protein